MNYILSTDTSILNDATAPQLEQAVALNHRELFCLNAICQGGEVQTTGGLVYTCDDAANGGGMVAFPSLKENDTSVLLDEMMTYYRTRASRNVGCWSLNPPQPADLGIRLLARGFQPGWQPCWMSLDLDATQHDHSTPPGLHVRADNEMRTQPIRELPYSGESGAVSHALMQAHPDRVQRFIATLNGEVVAQSCVLFTTGTYGVAGIYNVGVVPRARNQGIGKAVVRAACLYAKERGYRYAVLNATGRPMYEQVGFQFISYGLTWWLVSDRYITHPPSQTEVAMAEGVGRGDINELDRLDRKFAVKDLNMPITNGMTLVQLAVHCRQPGAAGWLLQHGAKHTAVDAWDLGWKDRAVALLAADPREVNRQYGERQLTLLHIATERNDIALAQLALSAKPDLFIKDKIYGGTASDWARYLHRPEITALIKEYSGHS